MSERARERYRVMATRYTIFACPHAIVFSLNAFCTAESFPSIRNGHGVGGRDGGPRHPDGVHGRGREVLGSAQVAAQDMQLPAAGVQHEAAGGGELRRGEGNVDMTWPFTTAPQTRWRFRSRSPLTCHRVVWSGGG